MRPPQSGLVQVGFAEVGPTAIRRVAAHCRWTASVTYVFRENVKSNELAVNPLGLTIVRFRPTRRSAKDEPIIPGAYPCPFLLPIRLAFPTYFRALWSRRTRGFSTCNGGGGWHPSYGGHACSNRTAMAADFFRQEADENFALELVCRYVSRLCSVTASGPFRRPAALGLLLRVPHPFGVSVPPKTSLQTAAQSAAQTSFGPPPRMQPVGLGSRAHSLRLRPV